MPADAGVSIHFTDYVSARSFSKTYVSPNVFSTLILEADVAWQLLKIHVAIILIVASCQGKNGGDNRNHGNFFERFHRVAPGSKWSAAHANVHLSHLNIPTLARVGKIFSRRALTIIAEHLRTRYQSRS
jgi:hypothetical protein